ncbi:MAG: hypothetical protein QXE66_00580 [Desulfurococcaceae archaeon]
MWLIALLSASVAATAVYFSRKKVSKYLLLILWVATLMMIVDWTWGYIEEGEFVPLEVLEDPLGSSLLGLVMVIGGIALWTILAVVLGLVRKRPGS